MNQKSGEFEKLGAERRKNSGMISQTRGLRILGSNLVGNSMIYLQNYIPIFIGLQHLYQKISAIIGDVVAFANISIFSI